MRDFWLNSGPLPSLATAMAERKQGYDLNALRSGILGNRKPAREPTAAQTPRGGGGSGEQSAHKKVKRKRPRRRSDRVKSDSESSSSGDDEREPAPRSAAKPRMASSGRRMSCLSTVSTSPPTQYSCRSHRWFCVSYQAWKRSTLGCTT